MILLLPGPDSKLMADVKGRIPRANPRAALHASGDNFRSYAVAERDAGTSAVAAKPGDEASLELLELHTAFYGEREPEPFYRQMIEALRPIVRLRPRPLCGVLLDSPPGG